MDPSLKEIQEAIEALQPAIRQGHDAGGDFLARLRAGDDAAFTSLVDELGPPMLRVAKLYVRTPQVAEEVVQETWLRVVRSLDRFEARSSLRTWIFVILANCARRRASREHRYVQSVDEDGGGVPEACFFPESHPRWAGMWATRVDNWVPEDRLYASEGRRRLREALAELPTTQALVFVLRDVEGWESGDVCELLELSAANQRVLLHRARSRIRALMEEYLRESCE